MLSVDLVCGHCAEPLVPLQLVFGVEQMGTADTQ